jgi:uncharacterized protein YunC (DUF1805 family)
MQTRNIVLNAGTAQGIEIPLPNAVLVIMTAARGYLACGYLNIAAAEKFGDAAAIIKGVKTVEDMLQGKVTEVTSSGQKAGITAGMTGREALERLL